MIASLACETGIPHQYLERLSGPSLGATLDYLAWRAEERAKGG